MTESFAIRNSAFGISPIHHLAPQGMAGFVLANGSMSSNQSGEGDRISTIYPLCA